jgi:predicted ATPase
MNLLEQIVTAFLGRADVGHLGLLLWAATASAAVWFVLRELSAANRRFDEFVRELNRFNARHEGDQP